VVVGSLAAIGKMVTGDAGDVAVGGPVKIVKMAATTLDSGLVNFLAFMSYLSLMLFIFNLLPLPALDGGRGLFLIFEAITRRKVNPKADVVINTVGFFLLIGLLLFMTVKDIMSS